jgi:hypothetical protein
MARARQGSHTAWCRTRPGLRRARRYAQQVWRVPPRLSSSLRASPSMRCRWSTACAEDGVEYAIGVRKHMRAAYSSSAFTAISAFAASFPCCVASSHSFSSAAKASNVAAKGGCFDGDFPGGIQSAFMWQSCWPQCASWQSPSVQTFRQNQTSSHGPVTPCIRSKLRAANGRGRRESHPVARGGPFAATARRHTHQPRPEETAHGSCESRRACEESTWPDLRRDSVEEPCETNALRLEESSEACGGHDSGVEEGACVVSPVAAFGCAVVRCQPRLHCRLPSLFAVGRA